MGKKSGRISYEERGDHTWELLDAIAAAKRAGGSTRRGGFTDAAKKAFDKSWDESTKARESGKKGR